MSETPAPRGIAQRFRGFLPVVVDVETGGFNPQTDALLEIGAVIIRMREDGVLVPGESLECHVQPFPGAKMEQANLDFIGLDPYHPFRMAVPEREALEQIFQPVRRELKQAGCTRAILVGHNPFFDLGFLRAAVERTGIKRNPFHAFSSFDTVTLGAMAYGQTVLARLAEAAGLDWDAKEAHSARYDAERTAELFCRIINRWDALNAYADES